ncbi:hypothetical protein ACEUDA_19665, partial [Aeromonas rivipollensis]|uniref:hypothetical protein n=1 Tax=Aeromonas rivipollensis TaxID=948519 RepID=UPI0038D02668
YAPHFESQAFVFAFLSAPTSLGSWLISSACSAVLVGAHYREPLRDGKCKTAKNGTFCSLVVQAPIYQTKRPA